MRLEQDISRRVDGKYTVWQRIPVTDRPMPEWDANGGGYEARDGYVRWVPVASFFTHGEALRFANATFSRSKARAPTWAGDGSGASLSDACTDALSE